jgi:hypothetical protein
MNSLGMNGRSALENCADSEWDPPRPDLDRLVADVRPVIDSLFAVRLTNDEIALIIDEAHYQAARRIRLREHIDLPHIGSLEMYVPGMLLFKAESDLYRLEDQSFRET